MIVVTIDPVRIGYFVVSELEIDLKHINYGLDDNKEKYRAIPRSNYSIEGVIDLFKLLHEEILEPSDYKNGYFYFYKVIEKEELKFSIIFCIQEEHSNTAGIITLYRVN